LNTSKEVFCQGRNQVVKPLVLVYLIQNKHEHKIKIRGNPEERAADLISGGEDRSLLRTRRLYNGFIID